MPLIRIKLNGKVSCSQCGKFMDYDVTLRQHTCQCGIVFTDRLFETLYKPDAVEIKPIFHRVDEDYDDDY